MRFYALEPRRMAAQVFGDLFVVVWVIGWWFIGQAVGDFVRGIGGPLNRTADLGADIERQLSDAATQASTVPLVGNNLRQPFDNLAATVADLNGTTAGLVSTIEQAASTTTWAVFAIPALIMVAVWLPRRIRFARRSREALALVASGTDTDLLALRALATQRLPLLRSVALDPVEAWRSGDPDTLRRLADLELRSAGIGRRARR